MIKPDENLEKTKILDNVLRIIDTHYPVDRVSNPVYLHYHLQNELNVESFRLLKYLKQENSVFEITKEHDRGNEKEADVSLYPEALQRLRHEGPWFESDLLTRRELESMFEHDSRQKRERIAKERAAKKIQVEQEKEERMRIDKERLEREQRAEEREVEREKREVALVKEVATSHAAEVRLRKLNLVLAVLTVISGSVAAYGALKNKLFDTKEIRLQDQITNLNAKIESNQEEYNKLLQQLNAIPDSIKQEYIE